jgi:hypothetical protein
MTPPSLDVQGESRRRRLLAVAARRPVLAVFLLALAARLAFIAIAVAAGDGVIIPDEFQYIYINTRAADGDFPSNLWNGYAHSLYDSTAAYNLPLTAVFKVFWPWRGFGMVFSAFLGSAAAAGAAALARAASAKTWVTLAAGALVALLPSQVLWSSVVLRETEIWAVIAGMAFFAWIALRAESSARVRSLALVAIGVLLAVGCYTRVQTAIVAGWALPVAMLIAARHLRFRLAAGGLALVLLVPMLCDLGPGGFELVRAAIPSLGRTRTYLSLNADTSYVDQNAVAAPPPTTVPGATGTDDRDAGPIDIANRPAASLPGGTKVITNSDGVNYAVEETFEANIKFIPRGLVATTLRPFPWEASSGIALAFARAENLLWYAVYVLAAIGLWTARRRLDVVAYPVLVLGGIFLVASVTQGNLGTAFRHRGQVMWVLAPLAALGLARAAAWLSARQVVRRTRKAEALVAG